MKEKTDPVRSSTAWLDLEAPYEEQEKDLKRALREAGELRSWAMEEMQGRWSVEAGACKVTDLLTDMTKWSHQHGVSLQHYTMVSVLNDVVAHFNQTTELKTTEVNGQSATIIIPAPQVATVYSHEITIESRSVWIRYLGEYGRISTIYGALYLQDGWQNEMVKQAGKMDIPIPLVPYLIYSASIKLFKEGWKIRFNIHHPNSGFGRKRRVDGRKKLKELR